MTTGSSPAAPSAETALARALAAVEIAPVDPGRALELLEQVTDEPPEAAVVAGRARGLAAIRRGELGTGTALLEDAADLADRAGLVRRGAEVRVSLTYALFLAGRGDDALAAAAAARPHLDTSARARLLATESLVAGRLGRLDRAVELAEAARSVAAADDRRFQAMVGNNLVWLHAYRGDHVRAQAAADAAVAAFGALEDRAAIAGVEHNRGVAAALAGDVAGALRILAGAESVYRDVGTFLTQLRLDRAEALLAAGLAHDARRDAEGAANEAARNRNPVEHAEALLMLARAHLDAGDPHAARTAAGQAVHAFEGAGRDAWAAAARLALLRARRDAGEAPAAVAEGAFATASALQEVGWITAAVEATLIAALAALEAGRTAEATAALDRVAALRERTSPPTRARAWHAVALLRRQAGDRRGAAAAVRAGLRVLDRFRSGMGAGELRVAASRHGHDLATLGVRLAVESRRPRALLDATERARAASLRVTPGVARDPAVAAALAELRAATAGAERAVLDGLDPSGWVRRQRALERTVQRRVRETAGTREVARPQPAGRIVARLGGRSLISYTVLDGRLLAVAVTDGRLSRHDLGDAAEVDEAVEWLRRDLRRVALRAGSPRVVAGAADRARDAAVRLADTVLPARVRRGDGELVVVPSGALHALPWSALPALTGRPVTVAPSAYRWAASDGRVADAADGPWLLSAGPGLDHADDEVRRLADHAPRSTTLRGGRATAAAVLDGLARSRAAHLACHGTFRGDNPLFSSLSLADGPVFLHDLERLRSLPRLLILSACDVGRSAHHPGDEVLGLTAALLGMGVATVVASVLPVDDACAATLMLALHDRLARGAGPAVALAEAAAATTTHDPVTAATAASFLCFGAG